MRKFYNFSKTGETSAELNIYGEIVNGDKWLYEQFGVEAVDQLEFIRELEAMGRITDLTLYINSTGGDVFAAQTMHNVLKRHNAKVTGVIDGLCASSACIIACACDTLKMPLNAQMMFHDVMTGLMGYYSAEQLRDQADVLDQVRGGIVAAYMTKSGKTEKELAKLMKGENWLTAKQCLEYGFADEVLYEKQTAIVNAGQFCIVNSIAHDLSKFEANPFADPAEPKPTEQLDQPPQDEALNIQRKRFFNTRSKINQ